MSSDWMFEQQLQEAKDTITTLTARVAELEADMKDICETLEVANDGLAEQHKQLIEFEAEVKNLEDHDRQGYPVSYRRIDKLQGQLTQANAVIQVLTEALADADTDGYDKPSMQISWAKQQVKEQG